MGIIKMRVYILHGWTYSTEKWQPILETLKQANIKTTLLEVPGLTGKSDKVWDIDGYVEWLQEATKKETEPFVLIGHSNGGRIAMAFSTVYSGRVKQLILIDSAGIYHDELGIRLKRNLFRTVAKVGKRLTSSDKARALLYTAARSKDYHDAPPHMRKTMANLLVSDKSLAIAAISVPTTIIWGSDDRVTPLSDAQAIHKLIKGSKLHVISGARHAPFFTHPEATAQILNRTIL